MIRPHSFSYWIKEKSNWPRPATSFRKIQINCILIEPSYLKKLFINPRKVQRWWINRKWRNLHKLWGNHSCLMPTSKVCIILGRQRRISKLGFSLLFVSLVRRNFWKINQGKQLPFVHLWIVNSTTSKQRKYKTSSGKRYGRNSRPIWKPHSLKRCYIDKVNLPVTWSSKIRPTWIIFI